MNKPSFCQIDSTRMRNLSWSSARSTAAFRRVFVVGLLAFVAGAAASQQAPSIDIQPANAYSWQAVPVRLPVNYLESTSTIMARGDFFDKLIGAPGPLDQPSSLSQGHSAGAEVQEEFPSKAKFTAVDGLFEKSRPYLSPSKRSIYTLVVIRVMRAVGDAGPKVKPGQTLELLIEGGAVVLPGSDKVLTQDLKKSPYGIFPGGRYLLFLRYHDQGSFYTLRKSWRVKDDKLVANSVPDARKVAKSQSVHSGEEVAKALDEIFEGR